MEDRDVLLEVNDLDLFIKEKLIPFRERIKEVLAQKYPFIFSLVNAFMEGKKNQVGLQVLDDGEVVREYTFHLEGINIVQVEPGRLDAALRNPLLGVVRPYGVIERTVLIKMINDEKNFTGEPLATAAKYLPNITIRFLEAPALQQDADAG